MVCLTIGKNEGETTFWATREKVCPAYPEIPRTPGRAAAPKVYWGEVVSCETVGWILMWAY